MTFDKTYIFSQHNNKDNFGRVQPANIGSGFNPLIFEVNDEQNLSLLPSNKSYMIIGANDVKYYDVKHLQLHSYIIMLCETGRL